MKELFYRFLYDIIAEAGGIALIISILPILFKFFGKKLVDAIMSKYKQMLAKQLELYKSNLNDKEHISQARFDKEFEIYQELSEKNLTMVYVMGEIARAAKGLFYNSSDFSDEEIEEIKNRACNNLNDADFSNKKFAPFIDKDIYEQYHRLTKLGNKLFRLFIHFTGDNRVFEIGGSLVLFDVKYHSKEELLNDIISNQQELSNLSDRILDEIRDYLKTLDVKE